jgi:hypothetical protein
MAQAVAAHDIPFKEKPEAPTIHVQAISNGYKKAKANKISSNTFITFSPQSRDLQG